MRLLITRPQPDADELAAELERRGHRCLVAPLMTIVPTVSDLPLGGVQALLLTSRNGVRALAAASARRDVPVLAVGPGTAAAAEDAGFSVEAGAGDVSALGSLVRAALKPGVFELGGSDPAIVLDDADLELAAEACAASRLFNSGQSCVCAKRFIVVRGVRREFEERFVARMAARKMGDPSEPDTAVGPLARADLRDALAAQVRRSVRRGARLLLGGTVPKGLGFYYPPTVLTDVRPGMPVFDEEVFGPVGSIVTVRDEAEAIRVANATPYGLAATLFTRSRARAQALVPQIEAGCVFVNDFVRSAPELPFGGIKESGFGRELGPWGIRAFVNVKTVWEA